MTEQSHNDIQDQHEAILNEIIQVKNCISLYSKVNIAEGEVITSNEINAVFTTLKNQLDASIEKYQKII